METQLPKPVSLKVKATLADYPNWEGVDRTDRNPQVIGLLGDGSNNHSVLVSNRSAFVIRVNLRDPGVNALDWNAERSAHLHAATAGLAPDLRYTNPQAGILVCDFLAPDRGAIISLETLAQLMRDIHQLPPIDATLSLTQRISHYETVLQFDPVKASTAMPILQFSKLALHCARKLQQSDTGRVLCHNDLLPANRLPSGGRLWAIDWEYAAMGSRWFDLAVVACAESSNPDHRRTFIEHYLGRHPLPQELRWLHQAAVTYRYLEALWFAANSDAFDPAHAAALLEDEIAPMQTRP